MTMRHAKILPLEGDPLTGWEGAILPVIAETETSVTVSYGRQEMTFRKERVKAMRFDRSQGEWGGFVEEEGA